MYYRFASKFVSNVEGGSRKRFLLYFRSFDLLFLGLNFRWRKRTGIFPLVLFRREEDCWYLRILLAFLICCTQTSNGEGQKGNCVSTNRPPGCDRMQVTAPKIRAHTNILFWTKWLCVQRIQFPTTTRKMKYMMANAEAASPMPPHARIPSYITAFQSSPVRIWWQEKAARL